MKEVKSITGETFEITETEIKIKSHNFISSDRNEFNSYVVQKSQLSEISLNGDAVELIKNNDEVIRFWINSYSGKSKGEILNGLNKFITSKINLELWGKIKELGAIPLLTELATQGPVPLSNEKIDSEQYRLLRSFNFITETHFRGNKGYYTATIKGFYFYQEMKGI